MSANKLYNVDLSINDGKKVTIMYGGYEITLYHGQMTYYTGFMDVYPQYFKNLDGSPFVPEEYMIEDFSVDEILNDMTSLVDDMRENLLGSHPTRNGDYRKAYVILTRIEMLELNWTDYMDSIKDFSYDMMTEGYKVYPEEQQMMIQQLSTDLYMYRDVVKFIYSYNEEKFEHSLTMLDDVKRLTDKLLSTDPITPITYKPVNIKCIGNPNSTITIEGELLNDTGTLKIIWGDGTVINQKVTEKEFSITSTHKEYHKSDILVRYIDIYNNMSEVVKLKHIPLAVTSEGVNTPVGGLITDAFKEQLLTSNIVTEHSSVDGLYKVSGDILNDNIEEIEVKWIDGSTSTHTVSGPTFDITSTAPITESGYFYVIQKSSIVETYAEVRLFVDIDTTTTLESHSDITSPDINDLTIFADTDYSATVSGNVVLPNDPDSKHYKIYITWASGHVTVSEIDADGHFEINSNMYKDSRLIEYYDGNVYVDFVYKGNILRDSTKSLVYEANKLLAI